MDVIVTRAEQKVESVSVDPPMLSDHSQIVATLALRLPHQHVGVRRVRRCWRQLDVDRLRCDILESTLVTNPPDNVNDLFACYDDVLRHLIDLHVPAKSVVIRPRPQSPWFDGECRDMKRATRRLERVYRSTHASDNYILWKKQLSVQRTIFQTKYADYWTSAIAECGHNGKALWSKVNCLLRPSADTSILSHIADDFATFFVRKVADIRSSTSGAPSAVIVPRETCLLYTSDAADE